MFQSDLMRQFLIALFAHLSFVWTKPISIRKFNEGDYVVSIFKGQVPYQKISVFEMLAF